MKVEFKRDKIKKDVPVDVNDLLKRIVALEKLVAQLSKTK